MPVLQYGKLRIDFSDAGSGDPVVLVHSSVSGNRQWKRLAQDLQPHFRVLAVNLFGYGETSAWNEETTQTIADQAELVLRLVRDIPGQVRIVGHSFGGSVACKAAAMLGKRASHLFLFEPTLFHLLAQNDRREAYAEAAALRDFIKLHGKNDHWEAVAERFIKYWIGDDGWVAMPDDRRLAYMQLLRPNYYEWDCVDSDQTTIEEFDRIPAKAMMVYSSGARRASREIAQLFEDKCPNWSVMRIAEGGHMAPLTHPEVVNPLIADFLKEDRQIGTAKLPPDESSICRVRTPDADSLLLQGCCEVGAVGGRVQGGMGSGKPAMTVVKLRIRQAPNWQTTLAAPRRTAGDCPDNPASRHNPGV